jgi:hypothetical protein
MLQGYKGFIALIAIVLNNLGFVEYSSEEVQNAVTVILAVIAFAFRILTSLRMKKAGVK